MTESKLDKAQRLLQCIYDFEANPPKEEIDAEVKAKRKEAEEAEVKRYGIVMSTPDSFGGSYSSVNVEQIRGDALMRAALHSGLSAEDVAAAGSWLGARDLINGSGIFISTNFRLTRLGEDLIDLGISVEEWYQGPYREKLLSSAPVVASSEGEEQ